MENLDEHVRRSKTAIHIETKGLWYLAVKSPHGHVDILGSSRENESFFVSLPCPFDAGWLRDFLSSLLFFRDGGNSCALMRGSAFDAAYKWHEILKILNR